MVHLRPRMVPHVGNAVGTSPAAYIRPSGETPLAERIQQLDDILIVRLGICYEQSFHYFTMNLCFLDCLRSCLVAKIQ